MCFGEFVLPSERTLDAHRGTVQVAHGEQRGGRHEVPVGVWEDFVQAFDRGENLLPLPPKRVRVDGHGGQRDVVRDSCHRVLQRAEVHVVTQLDGRLHAQHLDSDAVANSLRQPCILVERLLVLTALEGGLHARDPAAVIQRPRQHRAWRA
jgi:hypothetical protein